MKKIRLTGLLIAVFPLLLNAQSIHMDNILYGVAYYQEYMPYERLDEDVRMMKEAGISVVRVGESTWSLFEPREGEFEFEWMDRIIDKMYEAGIGVILGTPTYSIPAWLWHKHPEVLRDLRNGGKSYYGIPPRPARTSTAPPSPRSAHSRTGTCTPATTAGTCWASSRWPR